MQQPPRAPGTPNWSGAGCSHASCTQDFATVFGDPQATRKRPGEDELPVVRARQRQHPPSHVLPIRSKRHVGPGRAHISNGDHGRTPSAVGLEAAPAAFARRYRERRPAVVQSRGWKGCLLPPRKLFTIFRRRRLRKGDPGIEACCILLNKIANGLNGTNDPFDARSAKDPWHGRWHGFYPSCAKSIYTLTQQLRHLFFID